MNSTEALPLSSEKKNSSRQGAPRKQLSRGDQLAEALALAVVLAAPALIYLHTAFVSDPDVWWQMRTGQWILAQHAIPRTDMFTGFAAGKPWSAYSWAFEILIFKCFERLGLMGLVSFITGMTLAIAAAVYHLVRRLQPDFSIAALLTFVAGVALMRLYTPRPWLFTILFFTVQLDVLMHVRRTGKTRELLLLPVLYALWANIHIQFFDGLLILGLAFGESILGRGWPRARTRLSAAWAAGILAACILATLANPFGWRIYAIGYDMAMHSGVKVVSEMQSLAFRTLPDFCMLFLALAAAAALAAPRGPVASGESKPFPVFETALLAIAAILSFRSSRDTWVMVIAASAIVAQGTAGKGQQDGRALPRLTLITAPAFAAMLAFLLFMGSLILHVNNAHLLAQIEDHLPVRAVQVIKEKGYAGPLYNTFDWGGYLIWELRMPVSIDGRTNLDGDQRLDRSISTWNGAPNWASDPDLQSAGLVIGPPGAPLTQLLRNDSKFDLAYEDKLAAVFTAHRLHEAAASPKTTQAERHSTP
jgi:hypothetical protein